MAPERGWSGDPRQVARYRIFTWLLDDQATNRRTIRNCSDVAQALDLDPDLVVDIINRAREQGFATDGQSLAPIFGNARLTEHGKALAAEWREKLAGKKDRRVACRDALLSWLDDQPDYVASVDEFVGDARASFFGQPFAVDDVQAAFQFLEDNGLARAGVEVAEASGLRPQITSAGRDCLERFEGSISAYLSRTAAASTTISVSGSTGVAIAAASPGAQQQITTLSLPERLSTVASGLEALLDALRLPEDERAAAEQLIDELRRQGDEPADPARAHRLLDRVRRVAAGAGNSAMGQVIVMLVEAAHSGNIPLI